MTRLFRNILCPVDFSRHSQHALRYAALLASRTEARITALFVEDPLLAAAASGTAVPATTRSELRRFVERSVAPYGIGPGSIVVQTSAGKPYREIARTAERVGCDLIVMGAHGVTGAAKMMLGSTTERVLRGTTVPVLAIPPFKRRASTTLSRGWPEKRTLAPVDFGQHLRNDATTAADVAAQLGTLLVLLHVVPPRNRGQLLKARTRLETLIKNLKFEAVVGCRVLAGKPDEQIAAVAADADVDLVILTRRRGKGFFGARLGSISYQVLCEAGTPVLALPPSSKWLRRTARASVNGRRSSGSKR
jgi:universal stress protein F